MYDQDASVIKSKLKIIDSEADLEQLRQQHSSQREIYHFLETSLTKFAELNENILATIADSEQEEAAKLLGEIDEQEIAIKLLNVKVEHQQASIKSRFTKYQSLINVRN